jgi:Leu/Phe-tRNA-protein transferase
MTQSREQQKQQQQQQNQQGSKQQRRSMNSSTSNRGAGQRRLSPEQQELAAYVPAYLKPLVYPYHGEYCYTPIFKPRFIAQLMAEGFLPVATRGMLLPKLHQQRSVIALPRGLHVSKSVRKKAKRFSITINTRFDQVIQGCHDQHGSHCWLYPPLVAAFRAMMDAPGGKIEAFPIDENTGVPIPGREWPVRLYTVEVWNETTGELAGGELGYTVGSVYTSLTGFTKEDSAGSIQLVALGRLLSEVGFTSWDMGMHMEYKSALGAELMPRDVFLSEVHSVRETQGHLVLPSRQPAENCKLVIDRNNPVPPPQAQSQPQSKSEKGGGKNDGSTSLLKEKEHTPPQSEGEETPTKKKARKPSATATA